MTEQTLAGTNLPPTAQADGHWLMAWLLMLGEIWGGWLHVTYLWVAEPARGAGNATRLLQAAEAYAIERGCHGTVLASHSFQARPFYEKRGYEVFGTLEDYPPGHRLFLLKKRLIPANAEA
jgi:GNAT superfamily N-acetyltransferase